MRSFMSGGHNALEVEDLIASLCDVKMVEPVVQLL